jgi:hypothetical protein
MCEKSVLLWRFLEVVFTHIGKKPQQMRRQEDEELTQAMHQLFPLYSSAPTFIF